MNITLQVHSYYSPFDYMAFTANWQDDTHRYHVWIGIREGNPPYPVRIDETIYKNRIVGKGHSEMDINAAKNAKIKAEIKRLATYDTLMAMFEANRAEIKAADAMRAEAERLNRIYDAWKLLETATVGEKMTLGLI